MGWTVLEAFPSQGSAATSGPDSHTAQTRSHASLDCRRRYNIDMIGKRLLRSLSLGLQSGLRGRRVSSRPVFPAPPASAEARRTLYERDGFVLGKRLLDPAQLELLRAEFDRVFARRNEPGSGIGQRPVEKASSAYYCIYALREHSAAFDALVRDTRLVDMLSELIGLDSIRLVLDQVQYKPPLIGGENGWHRDMPTFPLIRPYTAITAWIALDDATTESGCMLMVPESHQWGDARDISTRWGIRLPTVYRGHEVRPVTCLVPAGHVHFHHDLVWHASGRNRSRHPRRAVAIHYINADARHSADELSVHKDLPVGAPMSNVLPVLVDSGRRIQLLVTLERTTSSRSWWTTPRSGGLFNTMSIVPKHEPR